MILDYDLLFKNVRIQLVFIFENNKSFLINSFNLINHPLTLVTPVRNLIIENRLHMSLLAFNNTLWTSVLVVFTSRFDDYVTPLTLMKNTANYTQEVQGISLLLEVFLTRMEGFWVYCWGGGGGGGRNYKTCLRKCFTQCFCPII